MPGYRITIELVVTPIELATARQAEAGEFEVSNAHVSILRLRQWQHHDGQTDKVGPPVSCRNSLPTLGMESVINNKLSGQDLVIA